jgi:hypothetical protein
VFKPGHAQRRVNLTLLFGDRENAPAPAPAPAPITIAGAGGGSGADPEAADVAGASTACTQPPVPTTSTQAAASIVPMAAAAMPPPGRTSDSVAAVSADLFGSDSGDDCEY